MRMLLDSNCLLQVARRREFSGDVKRLLNEVPHERIHVTDFGLHSVAIIMHGLGQLADYTSLIDDIGIGTTIAIVRLFPSDWSRLVEVTTAYGLDVDDAYQYVAAELDHRRIVSLDRHFDRTPRGRLTPAATLQLFKDEPT